MSGTEVIRHAAVALIESIDCDGKPSGRFLCVWNKRYRSWSFPGGLVEDGETVEQGLAREVKEEVDLVVAFAKEVFVGPHKTRVSAEAALQGLTSRGSLVHVFRVVATGSPRAMEPGCPIVWMSQGDFLAQSVFAEFYREVFKKGVGG